MKCSDISFDVPTSTTTNVSRRKCISSAPTKRDDVLAMRTLSQTDIEGYISLYLYFGIVKMRNTGDYWTKEAKVDDGVAQTIEK